MVKTKFYLEREQDVSVLDEFYSGIADMDNFIHNRLSVFLRVYNNSRFYVLREEQGKVIAMFVVGTGQLFLDEDCKDDLRMKFPDIESRPEIKEYWEGGLFPSIEINYLAVHKDYQHKHIGRRLIKTIAGFKEDIFYNHPLFLSVDAYCTNEYSAVRFYERCGFWASEFRGQHIDSLRMYRTLS